MSRLRGGGDTTDDLADELAGLTMESEALAQKYQAERDALDAKMEAVKKKMEQKKAAEAKEAAGSSTQHADSKINKWAHEHTCLICEERKGDAWMWKEGEKVGVRCNRCHNYWRKHDGKERPKDLFKK